MADVAPDPTQKPTVIPRGIATNLGLGGAAVAVVPVLVDLIKDGKLTEGTVRLLIIVGAALAALAMLGRFWQAIEATKAQATVAAPPAVVVPSPTGPSHDAVDSRIAEALAPVAEAVGRLETLTATVPEPPRIYNPAEDYAIAEDEVGEPEVLVPDDLPPDVGDGDAVERLEGKR
jgi:hypothetical protein